MRYGQDDRAFQFDHFNYYTGEWRAVYEYV